MKIVLEQTYNALTSRKEELEAEIKRLEEKLRSPNRTVEDIVRHIELLKEYKLYC